MPSTEYLEKKRVEFVHKMFFYFLSFIKMGQWFFMKQHLKNLESKPSVKLFNNRK